MSPKKDISCIIEDSFSDIDKILLVSDNERIVEKFQSFECIDKIIFTVTKEKLEKKLLESKSKIVKLPMYFTSFKKTVQLALETAFNKNLLEARDNVLVISNKFSEHIDTMNLYDLSNFKVTGFYDVLTLSGKIKPDVIKATMSLAIEMGKKGSEGKPIGAIFVLGDSKNVMQKSTAITFNPFESRRVNVKDSIIKSMIKNFSQLDGAFVLNKNGRVVAAHRYLKADPSSIDIPQGLGARHISAAAMTTKTESLAIVLSESDNLVRVFNNGKLIMETDPAEYT